MFILSSSLHYLMRADVDGDYFSSIGEIFVVETIPMVTGGFSRHTTKLQCNYDIFLTEQRLA